MESTTNIAESLKAKNTLILDENTKKILTLLLVFPIAFTVLGVVLSVFEAGSITGIFKHISENINAIMNSKSLLITDYFAVGGIGATLLNASFVSFFNLFMLYKLRLPAGGLLLASFFTCLGFAFFGKNILNIMPLYLGAYLYAKNQDIPFRNVFHIAMFSTALSPLVSYIANSNLFINHGLSQFIALLIGTAIGFIVMPLSSNMLKFHDGFNLYNVGFTSGVIGTILTSVLRSFDISVETVSLLSTENSIAVIASIYAMMLFLMAYGYRLNKNIFGEYRKIFVHKGRSITDFTVLRGFDCTLFNMGVMGILATTIVLIGGGTVNGPIIAGIFTVVGFSAFGKHPYNSLPVMFGVIIAASFYEFNLSSTPIMLAVLLSTTIAPISGTYGPLVGMSAGMLHLAVVVNIGIVQGGVNLYNNGFAGGLVAGMLLPLIDAMRRQPSRKKTRKP